MAGKAYFCMVMMNPAVPAFEPCARPRTSCVTRRTSALALLLLAAGSASAALDNPVMLQWFETSWESMERRMPDAFMAGYGSVWLPPPGMASTGSPGYDPFDRFDLGRPGAETAYGTDQTFRQVVREFQLADMLVYVDGIFNHNSGRTSNSSFIADGGWPGFYFPGNGPAGNPPGPAFLSGLGPWTLCGNFSTRATGNYFWGDFHNTTYQSENPGGANYCLWLGDLVGLIDIAQESSYICIRHPVAADPMNIPPGRIRNRPNAANARLYPDRSLTPRTFTNPGIPGFSATTNWTLYPFNTSNPAAGDATPEAVADLLMRYAQWMIEDVGIDGFRLDAAKHTKHDFWNEKFDAAVFNTRLTADGRRVTPFSFVESVDSNASTQFYTRKDGIGNRDALDLNEAGALRDLLNASGFGRWAKDNAADPEGPIERTFDVNDDGANNGSQGVHHVFSHDNGSVGNGGSNPALPTARQQGFPQNAYVLMRTGQPLIYYNGREMADRFPNRGFWPREGNPSALGNNNARITSLVRAHNSHARGFMAIINTTDPVNSSKADVLALERGNAVASNVLALLNDSYSTGFQFRSLDTFFPGNARLMELTGVWADTGPSGANLGGTVPRFITLDSNGRALFPVPNNVNSSGVETNHGYAVYGLPPPSGTLSVTGVTGILPADGAGVPQWMRRNTPVEIITTPVFEVQLTTTRTDAADPAGNANTDDFAVFRFNRGFVDLNGINPNGTPTGYDQPLSSTIDAGYERFVTVNEPLATTPGATNGLYRQVIDSSLLPEGMNYLSVIAYRRRTDGGLPVFTEFRKVVHIDRLPPQVTLAAPGPSLTGLPFEAVVTAQDRTTNLVYIIANVPEGVDPRSQPGTYLTAANLAPRLDRFEYRRSFTNLPNGQNSLTVVAFEQSGNSTVIRYPITNPVGSGDVNRDGTVNLDDLAAMSLLGSTYQLEADMNRNGSFDLIDRRLLELIVRTGEEGAMGDR
ncbi:MAG: dockerin type I domain-containing protein [Phycisphaerales bacterium]